VWLPLVFGACAALAQDFGDTPYVQTPQNVVDKMLEIAKVGPRDFVIDLGSGDGRMIIAAAKKRGARGFGVDHDRRLVALANRNAAQAGVADRAVFYERDLYKTDIRRATVMTIYLLPEVNIMVRSKLLTSLRPGTRIVSHDYDMGEWAPELSLVMDAPGKTVGRDMKSKVFYWVVPATVAGTWRWEIIAPDRTDKFELIVDQMFQKFDGSLVSEGRSGKVEGGVLAGELISFATTFAEGGAKVHYVFSGRVANDRIRGETRITRNGEVRLAAWSASRVEKRDPRHLSLPMPSPTDLPK
jgi:SAM-dependent methyltransferase